MTEIKIKEVLEKLYAIKDDDKFYFETYGEEWIKNLLKVYNVEYELPKDGEIVHVIGYFPSCQYHEKDTNNHQKGFWFIDGTGEKPSVVKEWYRLL